MATSQPATPAPQQPHLQDLSTQSQDFVLFDPHTNHPPRLNYSTAQAIEASRRSSHIHSASPSPQNRKVSTIIQSTGHNTTTTAYTNQDFPAHQPQRCYASSAPASSASSQNLQQQQQQHRSRPQVPLFSQSSGNPQQTSNTNMQDMDLYDDFTAFKGGAATRSYSSAYSSPAVPTIYDPTVRLSSSNPASMGTVSPQDLLRDPFTPAPSGSAAMTNLTSPSIYNESPQYDELEISPFARNNNLDSNTVSDPWYPLFPQEDQQTEQSNKHSPLEPKEELEVSELLRVKTRNRAGSASSPPGSHASISGVAARKRDKPLPPIIVEDPTDDVAMKRARNTLAARKSRQRKTQRFEELEDKISQLERERDHWKHIALQRNRGRQ